MEIIHTRNRAVVWGVLLSAFVVGVVLTWSAGYRLRWRRSAPRPSSVTGPIPANEETS